MSILVYALLKAELVMLFRGLNAHLRTALQHVEVCFDAWVVKTRRSQGARVENLQWLSQCGGKEAMAVDHARTDEGKKAANVVEISSNSVGPFAGVEVSLGEHV